jgi:hypothetical protein
MNNFYTGVGSRETTKEALNILTQVADFLSSRYRLRTGGAGGADSAFLDGSNGNADVYIPWLGFYYGAGNIKVTGSDEKALEIARKMHPAWERCSPGVKKLHTRNVHQLLGENLDKPSDFLICWTPGAKTVGGSGIAIRLAQEYNVPVINTYGLTFEKVCEKIYTL